MSGQVTAIRAGAPLTTQAPLYGLLTDLIGIWVGNGFNLISKPGLDVNKDFVLQVNPTKEILTFSPISGDIPDRGSIAPDLDIFALSYSQMVSDANTNELLHVERGMWLNLDAGGAPPQSITRLATIPHGNAVLAQGTAFTVSGGPEISPVSVAPKNVDSSPIPPGYFPPDPEAFPQVNPFPIDPQFDITNPNSALTSAIEGQAISNTTVLQVSTTASSTAPPGGGILNIPFVTQNANAIALDATFWIETVVPTSGIPFLQLQYTQTVILQFPAGPNGPMINWPHVSVSTLLKN
jgi:hypothetical protein